MQELHETPRAPGKPATTLKRRGRMAGAAALVAGLLARASEHVAQGADGHPMLIGRSNAAVDGTQVTATGPTGLQGIAPSVGVRGIASTASGTGVLGDAGSTGIGLYGFGRNGIGLFAESNVGPGVRGNAGTQAGVSGQSVTGVGVFGYSPGEAGVRGLGDNGAPGVVGQSSGTGVYAIGRDDAALEAESSGNGPAVRASNEVNIALVVRGPSSGTPVAALIQGGLKVEGGFEASGVKSAVVPHPDGTTRRLYCMESPKSQF
jgi:hypothetical protein